MKSDKFVVKLKRHSSSYETDQGKQTRKVFIDRCQNSRPTCSLVDEQPQASCATDSDDVSANPPSTHKIIDIGNFAGRSLSERDRKILLLNSWTPSPHDFRVVYTSFQKRRFQVRWLEEFKWLACSEIHEGSLCKWCVACVCT